MRIRALATWPDHEIAGLNIPRGQGYLVLKLNQDFIAPWGLELNRLRDQQQKRHKKALLRDPGAKYEDSLVDLEIDLQLFYRKRSINQNALLWQLYEIEANWANSTPAYRSGYLTQRLPSHVITSEDIHRDDLEVYTQKTRYKIKRADKFAFERAMVLGDMGKVEKVFDLPGEPELIGVEVWRTTSFLDTKEFTVWVERVIDRLKFGGLLNTDLTEFLVLKNQFAEILANGQKRSS